jgi:hypothetical protein
MTDYQPSPIQAAALTDRVSTMLPRVKASDERDARRNAAAAWRRAGHALSAAEVQRDLHEALDTLIRHINEYQGRVNKFMQTPAHMLIYIENVCTFIMRDYPRELDDNPRVTALWDAFDTMHSDPHAWRNGEYPHSAAPSIINWVHRMAQDTRAKSAHERPAPPRLDIDMSKTFDKPATRRLLPGFD